MSKFEVLRPAFEEYILTERGKDFLARNDSNVDNVHDYIDLFVQEAWEAWCAARDPYANYPGNPARYDVQTDTLTIHGVKYANSLFVTLGVGASGSSFMIVSRPQDGVITLQSLGAPKHRSAPNNFKCADCTMGAVPCPDCYATWWHDQNKNTMLIGSRYETRPPEITVPTHVHCEKCSTYECPGITERKALPNSRPSPPEILKARQEGRAEAFKILVSQDAEGFESKFMEPYQIADTGDYSARWNEDRIKEMLLVDDCTSSLMDHAEKIYWDQQGTISLLECQVNGKWFPIEAAEKDGRYILGWFPDIPLGLKHDPGAPATPWVAAVRWSGSPHMLWGMLGCGGLMPSKFMSITGPDGNPVGYIRDQSKDILAP